MDYVLTTNALTKEYGGRKALDAVSMHIPKGAIYGFVGQNGAGKTTLIRLICGLQTPTSGGYALYGRKNTDRDIHLSRRKMGAVVETPAVFLDMTAEENLKHQLKLLGLPLFDGLQELLETVGLDDAGNKKVRDFSLGMRQRLGVAVALCGGPDFLVLDEPINGLDPQGILEMRHLLLRLNRERGITVLISSHILGELSKLATHYGFLDRGRLVQEIDAHELDAACNKRLRVEVTDVSALARALDNMGVKYRLLGEKRVDIFDKVNVSRLTLMLARQDCELLSVQEQGEDLESYFVSLVGGKQA